MVNCSENELKEYVFALEKWFAVKQKVAVAFSGGVDSSLLLFLGSRVLGSHCFGLFAQGLLISRHQVATAKDFAERHNLAYEERIFSPFHLSGFSENNNDRCYICKKGLYGNLKPLWRLAGISLTAPTWMTILMIDQDFRPSAN